MDRASNFIFSISFIVECFKLNFEILFFLDYFALVLSEITLLNSPLRLIKIYAVFQILTFSKIPEVSPIPIK
jgi:hypothetical protein